MGKKVTVTLVDAKDELPQAKRDCILTFFMNGAYQCFMGHRLIGSETYEISNPYEAQRIANGIEGNLVAWSYLDVQDFVFDEEYYNGLIGRLQTR